MIEKIITKKMLQYLSHSPPLSFNKNSFKTELKMEERGEDIRIIFQRQPKIFKKVLEKSDDSIVKNYIIPYFQEKWIIDSNSNHNCVFDEFKMIGETDLNEAVEMDSLFTLFCHQKQNYSSPYYYNSIKKLTTHKNWKLTENHIITIFSSSHIFSEQREILLEDKETIRQQVEELYEKIDSLPQEPKTKTFLRRNLLLFFPTSKIMHEINISPELLDTNIAAHLWKTDEGAEFVLKHYTTDYNTKNSINKCLIISGLIIVTITSGITQLMVKQDIKE